MRVSSLFRQHRALRWLAPVGVLGVVGLAAGGMITAKASTSPLPDTTTATLLADVESSSVQGFSGTVVAQMSLGLPQLPGLTGDGGDAGSSSMSNLLAGAHTMRVWYGGPDQQRIALLGPTSESDLFHAGTNVWEWDSDTHVATRTVLPQRSDGKASATPAQPTGIESLTPEQLAKQLLATIDPTTRVTMGATRTVADRSAYDLVLTPRDPATRVGSVHLAIDGSTKMPLGVQVFTRDSTSAAVDVSFSDISFTTPPSGYFSFTPPPGATVHTDRQTSIGDSAPSASGPKPTSVGKGWSRIVEYPAGTKQVQNVAGRALSALPKVSGSWGQGRLLDSALFSVLVTDDGRVFAGAVDPSALYTAASTH